MVSRSASFSPCARGPVPGEVLPGRGGRGSESEFLSQPYSPCATLGQTRASLILSLLVWVLGTTVLLLGWLGGCSGSRHTVRRTQKEQENGAFS